jgi:hypothetical protein
MAIGCMFVVMFLVGAIIGYCVGQDKDSGGPKNTYINN